MNFREIVAREFRREYADHLHFDKGLSRSISMRASRDKPHSAIKTYLPLRCKVAAYARAIKYWREDKNAATEGKELF